MGDLNRYVAEAARDERTRNGRTRASDNKAEPSASSPTSHSRTGVDELFEAAVVVSPLVIPGGSVHKCLGYRVRGSPPTSSVSSARPDLTERGPISSPPPPPQKEGEGRRARLRTRAAPVDSCPDRQGGLSA
jgi:hypothetical protein